MGRPKKRNSALLVLLIIPIGLAAGVFVYAKRLQPKPKGSIVDAAMGRDLEGVEAHVASGTPLNSLGASKHTALYSAALNGDAKMVDYLLQKGASPNAEPKGKNSPLIAACLSGNVSIVRALVDKGADLHPINNDGQTPLHAAAASGRTDLVSYLLDKGLDPNAQRKVDHATPICEAASAGNWDCIELLRKRGGNIDIQGYHRRTPLSLTILTRHRDVARKLVDAGADVNIADADRMKPLHFCFGAGDSELALRLLPMTKDPGAYVRGGKNALYYAVAYAAPIEVDKALIAAGVSPNQKTGGQIPIVVARENKDQELIDLLVKAGAKE